MRKSKPDATRLSFRVKRTANEVPWEPPFQYECDRGHRIHADVPCCACPACNNGELCVGELTRVGPGSRTVKA